MDKVKGLYLCYGNEEYIKNKYVNDIKDKIIEPSYELMNLEHYDGKKTNVNEIIDSAETMPFMAPKRLLIIKDSGLFKSGRKEESSKLLNYIDKIPNSTCIIFVEKDIDKRMSLYKKVNKNHLALEFKTPSDREAVKLVKKELKNYQIQIDDKSLEYLVQVVPIGMESILRELEKLANYKQEGSVTLLDIDAICSKSLDIRIFELVKMLGNKNTTKALEIYLNLLEMKESPIGILAMMARQFRMILKVKYMRQQGHSNTSIVSRTGFRSFMVTECVGQASNFTFVQLENAIKECLEVDEAIKIGMIKPELGVEMILIKYSS